MSNILAGQERRLLRIAAVPMTLLALSCVYPMLFAVNNAFKTQKNYILDRFGLVSEPTLANFVAACGRAHLADYLVNSVIVTAGAVLLLLLFSSLAGYALAMLRFRWRRTTFILILATMMIPVQVVLVPFYRTMIALDLINTRIGLIIAYTAFFLPFCVYMMTAFYSRLPRELVESAHIDGASHLQIWWNIMLPMGTPALITLGILNTLYCWNDVLIALLVLQRDRTVMVGIAALLRGEYTTNVPLLTAGIVLAAAPVIVIYLVFQRRIVDGIAVGAVKG